MTKTKTMSVNFTVEGDFITDHFRSLIREENYRGALDGLKDSLIGMSTEQAAEILSGKAQLTKDNFMVEDDKNKCDEWLRAQYFVYFYNVIYRNKKFYKVYGEVSNLNERDCNAAMRLHKYETLPIDKGGLDYQLNFNSQRAETYLKSVGDIAVFTTNGHKWLLMNEVKVDYPIWLKGEELNNIMNLIMKDEFNFEGSDLDEIEKIRAEVEHKRRAEMYEAAEAQAINRLRNNNCQSLPVKIDPVDQYLKQQKKIDDLNDFGGWDQIKETIAKQADENGGWLKLKNPYNKAEYKIPKNPFYRWVLSDSSMYDSIEWKCVSPQGSKMGGDDPNHTDWWLFTDLDLEAACDHNSDHNRFFFKQRHKYNEKLTGANIKVLTNKGNHKGFERAVVRHVNEPEDICLINNGDIIIIPNASPDFEAVAYKCAEKNCVLITETGGALCHLAIVGREYSLCLVLLPNASKRYPMASSAKIDLEEGRIEALEVPIELLMQMKLTGMRYR